METFKRPNVPIAAVDELKWCLPTNNEHFFGVESHFGAFYRDFERFCKLIWGNLPGIRHAGRPVKRLLLTGRVENVYY